MLGRMALVRTDVSEEFCASIIRVTRIGEVGTFLLRSSMRRLLITAKVVPNSPILVPLMMEATHTSETSVHTRATWRHISEDGIIYTRIAG
jgi:hypothetical protein